METLTASPEEKVVWTCTGCPKTRTKPATRLPRGWKRLADSVFCDGCWSKRYMLRAITIPVASPVDGNWDTLRAALKEMWRLTTQCSNWMATELYAHDARRMPGEEKMPAMARQYLYPDARLRFPGLPSQSVAALEHAVQAKYRAVRYEVIWTNKRSLPTFRYPTPFAIPNQGWSPLIVDNRPAVSARIGDQRLQLRLRGGRRFFRQRQAFDALAEGKAVQGELAIYERGRDIMVKMVAWLERPEPRAGKKEMTLYVRTAEEELLVALDKKAERLWKYNGDHLRRWAAEHRKQLQRWSEDSKYEQRPVPAFAERRELAAGKYHRRMQTAVKEIGTQLVSYAVRRKYAVLRYDDAVQSYAPLPWHALRAQIVRKCDEAHIQFELASGEVMENLAPPLAEEDNE